MSPGSHERESANQLARRRDAARRREGEAYETRRLEIARTAARLFREKGYRATTLHDIAAELNVGRVDLYRYFVSKEDLLRECVAECVIEVAEQVREAASADQPAPVKLRIIIESIMRSYEKHYPHAFVYIQDALGAAWAEESSWSEQLTARTREIQRLVRSVVEQGVHEGSIRDDIPPELAVLAVLGAVNWSHRWFRPGRPYSGDEVGRDFAEVLLRGVTGAPPAHLGDL